MPPRYQHYVSERRWSGIFDPPGAHTQIGTGRISSPVHTLRCPLVAPWMTPLLPAAVSTFITGGGGGVCVAPAAAAAARPAYVVCQRQGRHISRP